MPWLTVETALGAPADVGTLVRRSGVDSVTRMQAYYRSLVAGVSHIRTSPLESADEAHEGRTQFTGIDLRWAYSGVQLRGEWLTGDPFDGATTTGWYADGIVHLAGMGPITAVARVEQLGFDEPAEHETSLSRRQTIGARVRLAAGFAVAVNLVHREGDLREYRPTSFDVGLTWSARRGPL